MSQTLLLVFVEVPVVDRFGNNDKLTVSEHLILKQLN